MPRVFVSFAIVVAALAGFGTHAQVTLEQSLHYGAPCPPPTKHDRWCLAGEAVVGLQLAVPAGATRVLRLEVPEGRPISRIQLTMLSRTVSCGCAVFDIGRKDPLIQTTCKPYDATTAGRGTFGAPAINGRTVTVTFSSHEPYVQQPFLRVYYRP
jgi:hypothetical protein